MHEETDPGFQHIAADALPRIEGEGVDMRLIAGSLYGERAPARMFSDMFNADVALAAGARFRLDGGHIERAAFVISGTIEVAAQQERFTQDQLVVFKPGSEIVLKAIVPTRLMALGGEPLAEKRHIFWNFVLSRRDRIEQAAFHWQNRSFPGVPGETEFTPLPDGPRNITWPHPKQGN